MYTYILDFKAVFNAHAVRCIKYCFEIFKI